MIKVLAVLAIIAIVFMFYCCIVTGARSDRHLEQLFRNKKSN